MQQRLDAPVDQILAGKLKRVGQLLHAQVADITVRTSTRRTASELGSTVRADNVARLTLQNGRQSVLETDGTFEQAEQVLERVGWHIGAAWCHGHWAGLAGRSSRPVSRVYGRSGHLVGGPQARVHVELLVVEQMLIG